MSIEINGNKVFSPYTTEEFEAILAMFPSYVIYGCGEVAELIWRNHEAVRNDDIKVIKTDPKVMESFHGNKVYHYKALRYSSKNLVIIAAHEKHFYSMFKNVIESTNASVMFLSEEYIEAEKVETVNRRRKEGIISLFYADIPNMGDQLNSYVLQNLFGYDVMCESVELCNMACIGSALDLFFDDVGLKNSNSVDIWGMGFGNDKELEKMKCIRPLEISALRGELTREKISKFLGFDVKCAVGDPGLLVRNIFEKKVEKKYKVGIIPHYREQHMIDIKELYDYYENSVVINLRNDVELVIEQIKECEVIISSSLHGAVVSDSFSIPNILVKMSEIPYGDGFKYRDYYSSYGLQRNRFQLKERGLPSFSYIKKNYTISEKMVRSMIADLIGSFPYSNRTKSI